MSASLLRAAADRLDSGEVLLWAVTANDDMEHGREVGKTLAAWLRDIDERHAPDPYKVELVLHYDSDEECETCEDGGHESTVCAGCFPTWEGMDDYAVWPCREWKSAETVARLIVGGDDG